MPPAEARIPRRLALVTGLLWALVYFGLATPRITAQGLYYDELHQATGAFAYVAPGGGGGAYSIAGLPVLNMPYSGAIKTGIYGLWLRVTGRPFAVLSWRILGCLFAAFGIFVACAVIARRLGLLTAHVLGALLATDMTVVLATRHDWGPVALALMLRLLLIAVWVREWTAERPAIRGSFTMGLLLGLAVFEKLSSVVVALPVGAAFLLDSRRRNLRQIGALLVGGLAGGLPLVLINLHSWRAHHTLASLAAGLPGGKGERHLPDFLRMYSSLGNGADLSRWILGWTLPDPILWIEGRVVLFLCGALMLAAVGAPLAGRRIRAAGAFAALYLLTGIGVEALPAPTWIHHWVIGTPLQDMAFALALGAALHREARGAWSARVLRWACVPAFAVLLGARVASVATIERAFSAGSSSETFDVEITEAAAFAARQSSDSAFIATRWGIANQIICLSNGRLPVREAFWNYRGPDDLQSAAAGRNRIFLIDRRTQDQAPGEGERILADARALPGFHERPVPEASQWRRVRVWRFDRVP